MEMEPTHPELSPREQQLIELAAEGLTDTAIAHRLGISEPTVKSYWGRVRIKLGPRNRTELVAHALKEESEQQVAELNGEIERLQSALTDSRETSIEIHQALLEAAPDAVLTVSEHGEIVWLNPEAERMFGYRFDELAGKPVSILVPEALRVRHVVHIRQYLAHPVRKRMGEHLATMAVRKDGEKFPISASLSTLEIPSGRLVICFVRRVAPDNALKEYAVRHCGCVSLRKRTHLRPHKMETQSQ